jgi:hypothetical protein
MRTTTRVPWLLFTAAAAGSVAVHELTTAVAARREPDAPGAVTGTFALVHRHSTDLVLGYPATSVFATFAAGLVAVAALLLFFVRIGRTRASLTIAAGAGVGGVAAVAGELARAGHVDDVAALPLLGTFGGADILILAGIVAIVVAGFDFAPPQSTPRG